MAALELKSFTHAHVLLFHPLFYFFSSSALQESMASGNNSRVVKEKKEASERNAKGHSPDPSPQHLIWLRQLINNKGTRIVCYFPRGLRWVDLTLVTDSW